MLPWFFHLSRAHIIQIIHIHITISGLVREEELNLLMLILAWMARRCPRRFKPFLHNSNKPISKDRLVLAHLIQPQCLICQLIVIMSLTLQELQQTTLVTFQVSYTLYDNMDSRFYRIMCSYSKYKPCDHAPI